MHGLAIEGTVLITNERLESSSNLSLVIYGLSTTFLQLFTKLKISVHLLFSFRIGNLRSCPSSI